MAELGRYHGKSETDRIKTNLAHTCSRNGMSAKDAFGFVADMSHVETATALDASWIASECSDDSEHMVFRFDPWVRFNNGDDLSHHHIDGLHLWIGVEKGIVVVLDSKDHNLFQQFVDGLSPAEVLARQCAANEDTNIIYHEWQNIRVLVAKLVKAGFVKGVAGHTDVRISSPEKFARLHITRRCQLQCIHCYAASGPDILADKELPLSDWKNIITGISESGGKTVLFTGGEPLVREGCPELIRHASDCGLDVTMFTNGLLVKKYLPEIQEYVDLVQVSLNGPDAETNDPIRGNGTFRAVIEAVDILVRAGVPVRIGMTAMELNWQALKSRFKGLADRYAGSGVTFHIGYGLCGFGRAKSLRDNLDLDQIRTELEEMRIYANGIQKEAITRKTINCGYCEQLVIASDGQVYPCHLLSGAMGHIFDYPLDEWYARLRIGAHEHRVDTLEICRECDLRNLCGGTCRVINQQETGSKWHTTCSIQDRSAKYRNLLQMFYRPVLTGVSLLD